MLCWPLSQRRTVRRPSLPMRTTAARSACVKPRDWRWLIEEANPGPRLEMFARQKAPGWQIWGNELPNDVDLHSPQNP
jgi:N6-adenosine-specific RNA methylase IME4